MFRSVDSLSDNDIAKVGFAECGEFELDELGQIKNRIVVDQFYSNDFMRAENGFCKSDMQALMDAQSEDLRNTVLSRLVEVKAQYPDQSLSDETIAKLVIPRSVQSSVDFRRWASQIDELGMNKALDSWIAEQNSKIPSDNKIVFTENSVSNEAE